MPGVARNRRAELMPAASLEPPSAASESARLSQPVTAVIWSPVPSTALGTDLRRVAALAAAHRAAGRPSGRRATLRCSGFSRTELLRALTTDSPLGL